LKIRTIKELLKAELLAGEKAIDLDILFACGSDLMSDVLTFVKEQTVLLTGLTNSQVVRTAELLDVSAIVFVRGKKPTDDILKMATDRDIAILTTQYTLFDACGILYQGGLRGGAGGGNG
jgi:predicted transcriptional regulator